MLPNYQQICFFFPTVETFRWGFDLHVKVLCIFLGLFPSELLSGCCNVLKCSPPLPQCRPWPIPYPAGQWRRLWETQSITTNIWSLSTTCKSSKAGPNLMQTQQRSRKVRALWDGLCSQPEFRWISEGVSSLGPTFPKVRQERSNS